MIDLSLAGHFFFMALPFFYIAEYTGQPVMELDEETSRHIVQVLRMKPGESLNLTDGKGHLLTAAITEVHRKSCTVQLQEKQLRPAPARKISIAISLVKNSSRFEWFLEKATEIGVSEILPLICERTEREKFRHDRMNAICISAMLQSQQCWLPLLREPIAFRDLVAADVPEKRFIAHCEEGGDKIHLRGSGSAAIILIGPEGDFSPAEIAGALERGFIPVSLGATRLRTETAGVVAAALLQAD